MIGGIKRDKYDAAFSDYIRARAKWCCEICLKYLGKTSGLHCSHFMGRRKQSTRLDPQNAVSACFGCHRKLEEDPEFHREFFRKRLGQRQYDALILKSNIGPKPDKEFILIWLKAEIKRMA